VNWDAIGAVAELFSALAVLITLIYLATQVRQGSKTIHNSTSWAVTQALADLNSRMSADSELTEIWLRGASDPDSLTPTEFARFHSYAVDWLNLYNYLIVHPSPEHRFYLHVVRDWSKQNRGFRRVIASVEPYMGDNFSELKRGDA